MNVTKKCAGTVEAVDLVLSLIFFEHVWHLAKFVTEIIQDFVDTRMILLSTEFVVYYYAVNVKTCC